MVNYNLLKYSAIIGMIPGVGKYAEEMTMRFINAQMFMQMVDQYMIASGNVTCQSYQSKLQHLYLIALKGTNL